MRALWLGLLLVGTMASHGVAQNQFLPGVQPGSPFAPGGGDQRGGNQVPFGQPGGAASADFDSLIELIISTVAPDTWTENGGTADIRPFPGGVWVDPQGVLRVAGEDTPGASPPLVAPAIPAAGLQKEGNPRSKAKLRCVSLPRLEAAIYYAMRDGKKLDESMLTMAGLQRVEYLFVYPDSGDVVVAGPAGDWRVDTAGRILSTETGLPVVRLDDLLVLLRREAATQGKPFGCSITPRQESLAATQSLLNASAATPLRPGTKAREAWLEEIRSTLGAQDIEVFGLAPSTHAARVLIEADFHMKRVALGLEEGVTGMDSYLDTVAHDAHSVPAMNVLRWWFATDYEGIYHNATSTAFQLRGQGVRVLSENEMLTERGERVHTGASDEPTQAFAQSFTQKFSSLAEKYPVYGELRNLMDLAIVASLLERSDLYSQAEWQPVLFKDEKLLPLPGYRTPKETNTIAAHRVVKQTQIVAAVSGGVYIDAPQLLKDRRRPDQTGKIDYHRDRQPDHLANGQWWWDLE